MRLLPLLDKPELKNEIIINRAEVMGVMGMYNEALEQLRQINPQALELGPLNYYYRTFRAYYGWVCNQKSLFIGIYWMDILNKYKQKSGHTGNLL